MADTDLTKASRRMLRRKLQQKQKSDITLPLTPKYYLKPEQIVLEMTLHRITGMKSLF